MIFLGGSLRLKKIMQAPGVNNSNNNNNENSNNNEDTNNNMNNNTINNNKNNIINNNNNDINNNSNIINNINTNNNDTNCTTESPPIKRIQLKRPSLLNNEQQLFNTFTNKQPTQPHQQTRIVHLLPVSQDKMARKGEKRVTIVDNKKLPPSNKKVRN